jgi:GAF domain-containing protein
VDRESWARRLSRAAESLGSERAEQRTADAVVAVASEVVPHAVHTALLVPVRRGRYDVRAANAQGAADASSLQLALDEGPVLEAGQTLNPVGNGNVPLDARWPVWGPRAEELGVRSALAVGMRIGEVPVGVLALYSTRPNAFTDADSVELASLFAVHAAQAYDAAATIAGLEIALESRHLIGVAQGILMLRYRLTIESSFELLRRTSSQTNVRLIEIARQVVDLGDLPRADEATQRGH